MADNKKISQLDLIGTAVSGDYLALARTSVTKTYRLTVDDLLTSSLPGEFSALTLASGPAITEFSTDGTLFGDSNTAVPTERAVKTYVDTQIGNAVQLNIVNTSIDTTGVIGDAILVDTTGGDVDITLVASGEIGKIIVYKDSSEAVNNVNIMSDGEIDRQTVGKTLNYPYTSFEFLCDGVDFYTI